MKSPSAKLAVCCTESQDPDWRWIEHQVSPETVRFEFVSCPSKFRFNRFNFSRFFGAWRAVRLAKNHGADVIVAHGPTMTLWCCLFAVLFRLDAKILAFAFNFPRVPKSFKRALFSIALKRTDSFVVFSNMEITIYAETFGIPKDKFIFCFWGVNSPVRTPEPIESGSYVTAVGGNSRDYGLLMATASRMPDIKFIVVARPQNLDGLSVPPNVRAYFDIPLADAMNILGHAALTVLPLVSSETPCGHVTIVSAMHLGVPVIATDSTGISDYIEDGETGKIVEFDNVASLSEAIGSLLDDPNARQRISKQAKDFATNNCSESAVSRFFVDWLRKQT